MGLWDTIKKTVSNVYTKVDKAVGGVLPGGYQKPSTTTPQPNMSTYTPAPQTSTPQPNMSTASGPVYAPAPSVSKSSSSKKNTSVNQQLNMSTAQGPAYAAPPSAPQTQTSTVAEPQTTTPTGEPQAQLRYVTKVDKDGTSTTYGVDPTKSFISQTGMYEYDFFTGEGQKERLNNALETISPRTSSTRIGGDYVPVASEAVTVAIDALNVASILSAGAGTLKLLQGMNKVGAVAMSANGAKVLADTTPAASGFLEAGEVISIGKGVGIGSRVATNTVTAGTKVGFIKSLAMKTGMGETAVGYILLATGAAATVGSSIQGGVTVGKEISAYNKDSMELITKLREAGMNDMADEIMKSNTDIRDGLDVIIPYIPYIGKGISQSKIIGLRDELNDFELQYNNMMKKEAEQAVQDRILSDQQADELKRQQDIADKAEQRAYNEKQTTEQRTYNEQQKQEQRTYNEQQDLLEAQRQAGLDASATESAQGSTLTFGLLSSSGATEFVDKDRAAQYYFSKSYEELTPAQKKLLNMLKRQ
jgi:hypothetical protein